MKPIHAMAVVGLLLGVFALRSHAQTEAAVAYARPVDGLKVDGSLDDWPKDMVRHPLLCTFRVYGPTDVDMVDLTSNKDLQASFMVGWNPQTNLLHVAVIVIDDELALANRQDEFTDAIELYAGGDSVPNGEQRWGRQVVQFNYVPGPGSYSSGNNPGAFGGGVNLNRTKAMHQAKAGMTIYEWAVEVFDQANPGRPMTLQKGMRLAFDLTVIDRDGFLDPTAFVCWGPVGGWKFSNRDKVGSLVLLAEDDPTTAVTGELRLADGQRDVLSAKIVEFRSENDLPAGIARTDAEGRFAIDLPPGKYVARAADWQGLRTGARTKLTVEEGKPVDVSVTATNVELPAPLVKAAETYAALKSYEDRTEMKVEARQLDDVVGVGTAWNFRWASPNRLLITSQSQLLGALTLACDGEAYTVRGMMAQSANVNVFQAGAGRIQMPQSMESRFGTAPQRLSEVSLRRMLAVSGAYGDVIRLGAAANGPVPSGTFQRGSVTGTLPAVATVLMPYAHRLVLSESPVDELRLSLADARLVAEQTLDGEPVSVVELDKRATFVLGGLVPCGPGVGQPCTLRLWISDRDHLIRKAEWTIDDFVLARGDLVENKAPQPVTYTEHHAAIQSNVRLTGDDFKLHERANP